MWNAEYMNFIYLTCRMKKFMQRRLSQLNSTQLMRCEKRSLKKFRLSGIWTPSCSTLTNWVSKSNGRWSINYIIIRSEFLILFIGQEPTTWPANNCLQIMVCSCAMPSNCLAANNILLKHKGNHAFLLLAIALVWKWQIASFPKDIH